MEPTNTLSTISLVFGLIRLARLMRVEEDRKKRLPWDAAAAAALGRREFWTKRSVLTSSRGG